MAESPTTTALAGYLFTDKNRWSGWDSSRVSLIPS